MSEVVVGTGRAQLRLAHDPAAGPDAPLAATLRLAGLEASRQVLPQPGSGFGDLADYFDGLAERWRGWDGARSWASLEEEMRIDARHRHGCVTLRVQLRHVLADWVDDGWTATGDVPIEPGEQLSHAAHDVRRLVGKAGDRAREDREGFTG